MNKIPKELIAEVKKQGIICRSSTAANYTTFSIGGELEAILEVNSIEEMAQAIKFLKSNGQCYRIVGAGSNLLVSDSGVSEWIIHPGKGLRYCTREGDLFNVGAASSLMSTCRALSEDGYSGLEFAGGIPASIGGAVYMNAGAHGGEISDILVSLIAVDSQGEVLDIDATDLSFAYRSSQLPRNCVVVEASFRLAQSDRAKTSLLRARCLEERKKRQPLTQPSAGSVFKNPKGELSAGYFIEKAGLKGRKIGGAMISSLHANWIVNVNRSATFQDVFGLIQLCQAQVKDMFAVVLDPEIILWND